jgi:hypothetical protein
VSLLSEILRPSGCGGRSIYHLLERVKPGEDMVELLAVTRLIACKNVRLFEASASPLTPPSTFSKLLGMARIAFDLEWGPAVCGGKEFQTLFCYRRADNVEWLQRQGGTSRVFPPHPLVNILLV